MLEHTRFSVAEAFNSTASGKTSISLICGFILIVTGCIGFILGIYKKIPEIHVTSLGFATLGATLLGIRRFTKDKKIEDCKQPEDENNISN